jgi:hypothetical protein
MLWKRAGIYLSGSLLSRCLTDSAVLHVSAPLPSVMPCVPNSPSRARSPKVSNFFAPTGSRRDVHEKKPT